MVCETEDKSVALQLDRFMSLNPKKWHFSKAFGRSLSLGSASVRNPLCVEDLTPSTAKILPSELKHVKTLGRGGFGSVELCSYENKAGKTINVAVKKIHPWLASSRKDVEMFLAECRMIRDFKHSSIVEYVGAGVSLDRLEGDSDPAALFCVQEFCDAGSLRSMLQEQMSSLSTSLKVYTAVDALEWCVQVASALDYMHSSTPPIIHRDLKPDNVLLSSTVMDEDGDWQRGRKQHCRAKLADFGLSKRLAVTAGDGEAPGPAADPAQSREQTTRKLFRSMSAGRAPHKPPASRSPESGNEGSAPPGRLPPTVCVTNAEMTAATGSLTYMAPEVFKGERYNEKVDIFSLGVIMYELFTGLALAARLYHAGTAVELRNHANRTSQGKRMPMPECFPSELSHVIESFWHQDPGQRPDALHALWQLQKLRPRIQQWHEETKKPRCSCF